MNELWESENLGLNYFAEDDKLMPQICKNYHWFLWDNYNIAEIQEHYPLDETELVVVRGLIN